MMNSIHCAQRYRARNVAFFALLPVFAFGQGTSNSTATTEQSSSVISPVQRSSGSAEETVVLPPFVVDATRDVGFVVASALAGGRLATDLKDTPAACSVLTREFIGALGLTNFGSPQANEISFHLG